MENAADQELVKEEKLKKNDREKFSVSCHVPEAVIGSRVKADGQVKMFSHMRRQFKQANLHKNCYTASIHAHLRDIASSVPDQCNKESITKK